MLAGLKCLHLMDKPKSSFFKGSDLVINAFSLFLFVIIKHRTAVLGFADLFMVGYPWCRE